MSEHPHPFTLPAWPSMITLALAGGSFLAGVVAGRALRWPWRVATAMATAGPTKLALVVQGGLKMGRGKLAAQCSHGTLLAYQQALKTHRDHLQAWEVTGQAKVVLKVDTEKDMLKVVEDAQRVGVAVAMVRDAGRTQIASGSLTVAAVGPGRVQDIDKVTGHLKLL